MIDFRQVLNREILNHDAVTSAGEDFFILDDPLFISAGEFPYRNDWLIATLCESGVASGIINLREYRVEQGGFIIILPGQVIVRSELSRDFKGKILLMSQRFAESLDIGRTLTLTASIGQRPYYQFKEETIDLTRNYLSSCRSMIRLDSSNPVLWDALRLLTRAFFIGANTQLKQRDGVSPAGTYGKLAEDFLALVERQYRSHRQLDYYAAELERSTKYLSRHIKEKTGLNATDWIEKCVMLDAQAQLISTDDSIVRISESLGFPSQSFFGKYFKRVSGMSPKEFRDKKRQGCTGIREAVTSFSYGDIDTWLK